MNEDLKPCPFCGNKEMLMTWDMFGNTFIACQKCRSAGPQVEKSLGASAAKDAWNRRIKDNE